MSLVRKRLELVSYPEPEASPGWSSLWAGQGTTQEGAGATAQNIGHGPTGQPQSTPMAGALENELEFWPHFTMKLIPGGSYRPLLPFL